MSDLISRLSEIRSQYNCFNGDEEPYYRALSEVIKMLSEQADGDTISRKDAIDALMEILDKPKHAEFLYTDEICKALGELPSAQPEQRWIRCDKELPEEYGEYRITWTTSYTPKKRFIGDSEYEVTGEWDVEHGRFKGEWLLPDYIKNYPDVKVLAWKPLEEPYREEGGE